MADMAKKILIVEDSELNMMLFHDLLEPKGYDIVQMRGGMEELKIARAQVTDLILMDIHHPKVCGLDVPK
jgi:two-component system cell cycle response regulator DivK